jgi:co-chaperonin GroES (HSP10)
MRSHISVSKVEFKYDAIEEAFPVVDCRHEPYSCFVIVQLRASKNTTRGGIILPDDARHTEQDNCQVAKVIKLGPGAFKSRDDRMEPWPEGPWYAVGDFVRAPKFGGDRWSVSYEQVIPEHTVSGVKVPAKTESGDAVFMLFKDLDIRAKVIGDPLTIKAYL